MTKKITYSVLALVVLGGILFAAYTSFQAPIESDSPTVVSETQVEESQDNALDADIEAVGDVEIDELLEDIDVDIQVVKE